jgi:serine/threonine-protein phosphatase 2A regulatory subunit A
MIAGLGDSVFSIREAAAANLGKLVARFGSAWAEGAVLPRVLALIEAGRTPGAERPGGAAGYQESLASTVPSSQLRMTGLLALVRLGEAMTREACAGKVLPAVLALAGDSVPNVRFNAAKALGVLKGCLEPAVLAARVKPALAKLREDVDQDVRFFAGKVVL